MTITVESGVRCARCAKYLRETDNMTLTPLNYQKRLLVEVLCDDCIKALKTELQADLEQKQKHQLAIEMQNRLRREREAKRRADAAFVRAHGNNPRAIARKDLREAVLQDLRDGKSVEFEPAELNTAKDSDLYQLYRDYGLKPRLGYRMRAMAQAHFEQRVSMNIVARRFGLLVSTVRTHLREAIND